METIVILPKTKPLSAPELILARNIEIGSLKVGLKKTKPDGTLQEAEELARVYSELKKHLSTSRIERLCGRSAGEWDSDRNAVKILRKEGKFEVFGYSLNGELYLEYYEALFLLELNRLEILYHSMRVSIEQAYLLLLGEEENTNFNNYLVYSLFSRVGYIVQRHQNRSFASKEATAEDCIWEVLLNLVNNKPVPDHIRKSEHFTNVQKSMNDIRFQIIKQEKKQSDRIVNETEEQTPVAFQTRVKPSEKRKAEAPGHSNPKRTRHDHDELSTHKSFIDFLTDEREYKKFEGMFQMFDIVKLKPQLDHDETKKSRLEIQFDVYLHNASFKKSEPKPPAFRIAILKRHQEFPNRNMISRCYYTQEYRVPVLVVSVSDSKQIQAFLYHFT